MFQVKNTVAIVHRRRTPPSQPIHIDRAESENTVAMCRESVQAIPVSNDVNSAVPHMLCKPSRRVAKLLLDYLREPRVITT